MVIVLALALFFGAGTVSAHTATSCWQDGCNGQNAVAVQHTVNGTPVTDGYGHLQGYLYIDYSGVSGGGVSAAWADFVQNSGETLKSAYVEIVKYYDANNDTYSTGNTWSGGISGPHGWQSQMAGFEGGGNECFYAYTNITSNNNSMQQYSTGTWCPS
jgi:hypothetical protein